MKKIKIVIISIIILYCSAYFAFYFEESYRKLIRNLFELFTENKISFINPGKYLHFASGEFVATFALFILGAIFLFQKQTKKQNIINVISGITILLFSILAFCYIDSFLKLAECTTCENGERKLNYDDINYDNIFIVSLILTIFPSIIMKIKNHKKIEKYEN